jgi:hypothetical protein
MKYLILDKYELSLVTLKYNRTRNVAIEEIKNKKFVEVYPWRQISHFPSWLFWSTQIAFFNSIIFYVQKNASFIYLEVCLTLLFIKYSSHDRITKKNPQKQALSFIPL